MVGRRVPDGTEPHEYEPGDYGRVWLGGMWLWFCRAPVESHTLTGNLSHHTVTEHDDGTITVAPSILMKQGWNGADSPGWHGFLKRGTWRLA